MVEVDNQKVTLVFAVVIMFIGVTIVPMLFSQQIQVALDNQNKSMETAEERFKIQQEENRKDSEETALINKVLEQQMNLNNKINELFFLRNATVMPTNVFVPNSTVK